MTFYDGLLEGEGVSATTATPSVDTGTYKREGGSLYVYAYNASNYEVWPGDSVYLATYTSGYSFTATNAASQVGPFAGGIYHTTISAGYYGWVVVDGISRVRPDTSAVSANAGDYLACGVNNGFVAAPATLSTSTRKGYVISSMVTNLGASAADCGKAWIKSDVW